MSRRGARVGWTGILVAGSAIALLGVVLGGPIVRVAPGWKPIWDIPAAPSVPATPKAAPSVMVTLPGLSGSNVDNVVLLLALIGAVAVLGLLVRWLLRHRRGRSDANPEPVAAIDVATDDRGAVPRTIDGENARNGLVAALERLDAARGSADAVISAWLVLEEEALRAGAGRGPGETPAEYAVRIIQRFDADRLAADELRMLYERARFGRDRLPAEAVPRARRALEHLLASWTAADEGASR